MVARINVAKLTTESGKRQPNLKLFVGTDLKVVLSHINIVSVYNMNRRYTRRYKNRDIRK